MTARPRRCTDAGKGISVAVGVGVRVGVGELLIVDGELSIVNGVGVGELSIVNCEFSIVNGVGVGERMAGMVICGVVRVRGAGKAVGSGVSTN